MRKMKKLLAVIVTLVMALAMAIPAMATSTTGTTYSITIESQDNSSDHVFYAYQVFSGTLSNDEETLSDVKWGSGVNTETTYSESGSSAVTLIEAIKLIKESETSTTYPFNAVKTAADVAKILSGYGDDSYVAAQFAATVKNYLKSGSGTPIPNVSNSSTYTKSGFSAGYYLIVDNTTESSIKVSDNLLKLVGNVTISAKVDTATVAKYAGAEATSDNTSYSVGSLIPYTLVGTLPADYSYNGTTKYTYVFTDTMSQYLTYPGDAYTATEGAWTFDQTDTTIVTSGVTVKIGDTDVTDKFKITYTEDAGNTGGHILKIEATDTYGLNGIDNPALTKDSVITVTYKALLQSVPDDGTGIDNTVSLTYKNDSTSTTDITERVFPINLQINKVDGNSNAKLAGAEFVLYRKSDNNGTAVTEYLVVGTDGTISWSTNSTQASTLTSDANGKILVEGLAAGTYYLQETKAPDSYNKLTDDVELVITGTVKSNDSGELTLQDLTISQNGNTSNGSNGTVTAKIENNQGATLPSTGGIGTTVLYVIGGILVAAAAVILITRRRMNAEK